jgi:hypothetical protein
LNETNQTREQLKDPEWAASMLGKTLLGACARVRKTIEQHIDLAHPQS